MDSFMGYGREDGSVGVRNYVAVIPSVACAAPVAAAIARAVPGVVPLLHGMGCGRGGSDADMHTRTFQNLCKNPNVGAVIIVGLGCEVVNAEGMALAAAMAGRPHARLMIQAEGGSRKTTAKGIEIAKDFMTQIQVQERKPFPLDKLTLGLECGGSDAFSGVTANPAVGRASDWLVAKGGKVILTETTEMIGTSHILERRSANPEIAEQIKNLISSVEAKTYEVLGPIAKMIISPGNMDGGMSSIREKALGCIIKGGTTPINQVVDYAEIPTQPGLSIMHGPGYDAESLTGLAASGAQVIVFTTGRGNPIGFPIVPVVKVASTSRMFQSMEDDMDLNAGAILEGKSLDQMGEDVVQCILDAVNGRRTKAEINEQDGVLCVYSQNTSF
ncbi:UxaA family hydrolase [Desulfatibacillum aliphaticivorans]|uniref:UxaA family hydrolase n=1 Tax=Desulfatibacillum aliphaticivorans TaxID=218208 RepID=UPI0003F6BAD4|nr:UxaA family hydrolase [Desulfatibacillum aliphaticivorans]